MAHLTSQSVFAGSKCLHNGQSATFTALNGSSQQHLLRSTDSNESVGCIEAHGTGTSLGDPVEIGAISAVLGQHGVTVSSLKSNMGHLEGSAGAGGLSALQCTIVHSVLIPNVQL